MKKKLLTILLYLIIYPQIYSQSDSTLISNADLISSAMQIKKLQIENENLLQQNKLLKDQILDLQTIHANNLSLLNIKDKEIELYKNFTINVMPDNNSIYKKKWFEKPSWNFIMGVITGVGTIYIGATIVKRL